MSARGLIQDVSDTARWVAHYRALESERPDRLFCDPFARRLAGERGRAIAESLPPGPLPWALAVRTRVFDELILDTVRRGEADAVLNLAAGLDARPYRLALPGSLRWIEVDLPGILDEKTEALAAEKPRCAVERVPLDLADREARTALLARVAAEHARVLVVTEGLLEYLDAAAVGALADDLRAAPSLRWWVLAVSLPVVLARRPRAWKTTLQAARAEMRFAPASGLDFFRPHGWEPRVRRSMMHEARQLGREARFVSVMRALSSLTARGRDEWRRLVEYAVLERGGETSRAAPS